MSNYKISFCTVCMNRRHHLMQTLRRNIFDNEDYPDLEFVLLDYNSKDGLETFIRENFAEELANGKLIYYKTNTPLYFNRSHSRNMVNKLSSGDIICNIDADNYAGENFAAYVNDAFKKNSSIFLTAFGVRDQKRDVLGRSCVKRTDFYPISGYDERMVNYGFEDIDFINRLELLGLKRVSINVDLHAVEHQEKERLMNESLIQKINSVYLNYLTPSSTDLLFLFNDNSYKSGTVVNNTISKHNKPVTNSNNHMDYLNSFLENKWTEGKWYTEQDKLLLRHVDVDEMLLFNKMDLCFESSLANSSARYYQLLNPELIEQAVMFLSQITNRILMEKNLQEKKIKVNKKSFGAGVVYKNFNYKIPIIV